MHTKTVTYTDFLGTERTEDLLFHLSETEIMDMQLTTEGGFDKIVDKIMKSKDQPEMIKLFKELVLVSYGVISSDGRVFEKSEELKKQFSQSAVFNKLYLDLLTDDEEAANFVNSVLPNLDAIKAKVEAKQLKANK